MNDRLKGRVAIVTGGGHGIGKAYATRLASEGAKIVIAELDEKAGQAVAQELNRNILKYTGIESFLDEQYPLFSSHPRKRWPKETERNVLKGQ